MPSPKDHEYWFPAKRYGWGWGMPSTWQGWVVLLVYAVLILGGIPVIQSTRGDVWYIAYGGFLTIVFIAICWFKGERPGWRGSDRNV